MKDYLLYSAEKGAKFDDGEGNGVSLGEHLEYVYSEGGTPDCFDIISANSLIQAKIKAKESGLHLYIVDCDSCRVVGRVNEPQIEDEMSM